MSDSVSDMVEKFKQWVINPNNPGQQVLPKSSFGGPADRNYSLQGTDGPKTFLQHENQTFGINLGWTDHSDKGTEQKVRRWFFAKNGDGPIHYGDVIALANGQDPSFLENKKRSVGINLEFSKTPVFEWKILGGTIGQPVITGQRVAIFNMSDGEPLIFFDRTAGGDIGWPSSQTWWDQAERFGKQALKEAMTEAIKALLK